VLHLIHAAHLRNTSARLGSFHTPYAISPDVIPLPSRPRTAKRITYARRPVTKLPRRRCQPELPRLCGTTHIAERRRASRPAQHQAIPRRSSAAVAVQARRPRAAVASHPTYSPRSPRYPPTLRSDILPDSNKTGREIIKPLHATPFCPPATNHRTAKVPLQRSSPITVATAPYSFHSSPPHPSTGAASHQRMAPPAAARPPAYNQGRTP